MRSLAPITLLLLMSAILAVAAPARQSPNSNPEENSGVSLAPAAPLKSGFDEEPTTWQRMRETFKGYTKSEKVKAQEAKEKDEMIKRLRAAEAKKLVANQVAPEVRWSDERVNRFRNPKEAAAQRQNQGTGSGGWI